MQLHVLRTGGIGCPSYLTDSITQLRVLLPLLSMNGM